MLYLYNFLFLTFFLIICELKILKKSWYKNIVIFYFLFIFGQRWAAGVDFYGYLKYYITDFKTEIGYRIIQDYLSENNIYFGILIFFIYLFTTLTSVWFLRKFFKSNYMVYIFFLSEYHMMSINPLRTYIAINFFLIGIYNLFFYKKIRKCILFLIIGSLFHKLIFFTIPFVIFLVIDIKTTKKINLIIITTLFILPLVPFYQILKLLVPYIPKYGSYIGSVYDIPLSWLNIFRYYVILIFYTYFYNNKIKERNFIFINRGMLIFMFLMGLAVSFAPFHRVAYFFKIFEVLYFSYFFIKEKYKYKKILILGFFILNYFVISYKDMGVLKYYELKILHLKNYRTYEEYREEIILDNFKKLKYIKLRER